ncbi:glycosyl transferase, family 2 [unidentified eubacterium SCB49]|nr:glycosyl transferase, family 2 [unidentified eubacterium SCB49]
MENKCTIIIVTYNGMQWIKRCLDSCVPYSVIVVDNNSSDGTQQYIKDHYPEVVLLDQKENLGFGQGNNLGISEAIKRKATSVFLLNQDAYLVDDALIVLEETSIKYPEYGVLSPIHLNGKGTGLDKLFSNYVSVTQNKFFYSDYVLNNKKKDVYSIPFVNAAGWFIPVKVILELGGFDPIFFHYAEDDNYCHRVHFHKYAIGVVPNAYMCHDREDRVKQVVHTWSDAYFKQWERSMKTRFANINKETKQDVLKMKLKLTKHMIKSLLKCKFKLSRNYYKQRELLIRIQQEIETSRAINKNKGAHYLKL